MFQIKGYRDVTSKGNIWPWTASYTREQKNGVKDIFETTGKTLSAKCRLDKSVNVKLTDVGNYTVAM